MPAAIAYRVFMSAAMSFALIAVFALGIPTFALSFFILDNKNGPGRYFSAFQAGLLLLMLSEALIFFLGDRAALADAISARATRGLLPALYILSHALLVLLALVLFLLVAELTAMSRWSAKWRFHAACVLAISGSAFAYTLLRPLGGTEYFARIRHFDAIEDILFVVFLYPISLAFIRFRRIENQNIAKASIPFFVLGLILIPIAVLEDLLMSRPAPPDLIIVLPFWYIAFNGIVVYSGLTYMIRPRSVAARSQKLAPEVLAMMSTKHGISPREEEVTRLLIDGHTNKEIGSILGISPATARNHIHSVYEKTGASNRVELTRIYIRR
jgi:DNA-binding CsgD family transcriptional regulator